MGTIPKFVGKRIKELNKDAKRFERSTDTAQLVTLAIGYNKVANEIERDAPDNEELFLVLKRKSATHYERVGQILRMGDALVMGALMYLQAGDAKRAARLLKQARQLDRKRKKIEGFLNPAMLEVARALLKRDVPRARHLIREHERKLDPQMLEVLQDTIALLGPE